MAGSTSAPQLPGYRHLAPLGRGGYSEVYRAYQDHLDRWVAVKVLTFALTDDRTQRGRCPSWPGHVQAPSHRAVSASTTSGLPFERPEAVASAVPSELATSTVNVYSVL